MEIALTAAPSAATATTTAADGERSDAELADFSMNRRVLLLSGMAAAVGLMRRSILTEKPARRGHHITREYSIDPFELARVRDVMDREVPTAPACTKLTDLSDRIGRGDSRLHERQGTLIVDGEQRLVGIITRGDLVRALRQDKTGEMTVAEGGCTNLVVTYPDEPQHTALTRMLHRNIGRLPVVERNDPTRAVGYLGRAAILSARMRLLDEEHRLEKG
jgi:CIC family chloride channel protein